MDSPQEDDENDGIELTQRGPGTEDEAELVRRTRKRQRRGQNLPMNSCLSE